MDSLKGNFQKRELHIFWMLGGGQKQDEQNEKSKSLCALVFSWFDAEMWFDLCFGIVYAYALAFTDPFVVVTVRKQQTQFSKFYSQFEIVHTMDGWKLFNIDAFRKQRINSNNNNNACCGHILWWCNKGRKWV